MYAYKIIDIGSNQYNIITMLCCYDAILFEEFVALNSLDRIAG